MLYLIIITVLGTILIIIVVIIIYFKCSLKNKTVEKDAIDKQKKEADQFH